MQQTISKFNIYEHLAFILVGLLQIVLGYVMYIVSTSKNFTVLLDIFELKYSIPLILLSYFVGHVVQAISNLLNKAEIKKKGQNESFKYIHQKVIVFFNISEQDKDKIFQYCYFYVLNKSDILGKELLLFNSLYGLYRGFSYSLLISVIFSLLMLLVKLIAFFTCKLTFDPSLILYSILCFSLFLIFRVRTNRFFNYLGSKTYIAFDVLYEENIKLFPHQPNHL